MRLGVLRFRQTILLIGDTVCFVVGLLLTLIIRYGWPLQEGAVSAHKLPFAILFVIWLAAFYVAGLYNLKFTKNKRDFFALLLIVFGINAGIAAMFFYFLPFLTIAPKTVLFLDLSITLILLLIWRIFFNASVKLPPRKLAILGSGVEVNELIEDLKRHPQQGYQCVLHMASTQNTDELTELLEEKNVDVVVVAVDYRASPELQKNLFSCISMHIQFFDFVDFYERYFQKIPLAVIDRAWFLENLNEPGKQFFSGLKRTSDIILAILLGIVGIILSPFIICAIWIDFGRPIFYSQKRISKFGKQFDILKFRTMKHEGDGSSVGVVGKFLRSSHLDEIPQLVNILAGDMSFVGPRPEQAHFVEGLKKEIPFYEERLLVRPGITGWAQLHEPHAKVKDALSKLQYDLFYIKHRSLLLDLEIILKTLRILLS